MTIIVCESRFSMKKEDRDRQDSFAEYLDDIKEWNEHQYNEGYWSGGKMPLPLKYGGRRLGIALTLVGVALIVPSILTFDIGMVIPLLMGIAFVVGGIVRIRGKK
jgi:hypothetical protein